MSQQLVKPKQIAPSVTNGQVLTTVAGVTTWANDAGGTTEIFKVVFNASGYVALRFDGTIATART